MVRRLFGMESSIWDGASSIWDGASSIWDGASSLRSDTPYGFFCAGSCRLVDNAPECNPFVGLSIRRRSARPRTARKRLYRVSMETGGVSTLTRNAEKSQIEVGRSRRRRAVVIAQGLAVSDVNKPRGNRGEAQ